MPLRQSFIKQTVIHCSPHIFCTLPDGKSKALQFGIKKGKCVCVFPFICISQSPNKRKCLKLLEMQTVSSAPLPLF